MRLGRALTSVTILLVGIPIQKSIAQTQQPPSDVPTIHVTSRLVFLDVTVLDKKGRPVVSGLTKDDFTITEDKRPQRIFSFEPPQAHTLAASAGDGNPDGKAPATIFVLDLLNSSFEDFAFIHYSVRKYLVAQPPQLDSPAEMMVIGNQSLDLLQGYTRSSEDLLYSLDHLPPILPYKWLSASFDGERFKQSLDALQQIALENKGVPGRKNIIWVGHGSPSLLTKDIVSPSLEKLMGYMHATTNLLVDARISLFVIYPGLKIGHFVNFGGQSPIPLTVADAITDPGDDDPFAGDINFGKFVNETGGNLFYNRNDVDAEIRRSQQLGSQYYTLTYQPDGGNEDGKFRRIRVTPRDPSLRVVTKTGFFAPDRNAPIDSRRQKLMNLSQAARSTIPFTALDVGLADVVRHPDTRTVTFTVLLGTKNVGWEPAENGRSSSYITVATASLTGGQDILASKVERLELATSTQDPTHLDKLETRLPLTIRVPRKTQNVRVVIEAENGGRIGAADLNRQAIEAAPAAPTTDPQLISHQQDRETPPASATH
jgi:VWFA-related protein